MTVRRNLVNNANRHDVASRELLSRAHLRESLLHPLRCEHVHFAIRQRSVSQLGQCHGASADQQPARTGCRHNQHGRDGLLRFATAPDRLQPLRARMNETPDLLTSGTTQRRTDEGSREHGSWRKPPKFVLVERQRTAEDESVETDGGPAAGSNASGPLIASRNVTGRPSSRRSVACNRSSARAREHGDVQRGKRDLPRGERFVPAGENQPSEIRPVRIVPSDK